MQSPPLLPVSRERLPEYSRLTLQMALVPRISQTQKWPKIQKDPVVLLFLQRSITVHRDKENLLWAITV